MAHNSFIFGPSELERIVSCIVQDGTRTIFIEHPDGRIEQRSGKANLWLLCSAQLDTTWLELDGNQHYKWFKVFRTARDLWEVKRKHPRADFHHCYDEKEQAMLLEGFTYFKGVKHNEVSILGMDIEATTLDPNAPDARVLLITNTFRGVNGHVERKLFAYDEYETEAGLFRAWSDYVLEKNPSLVVGHNVYGYDFPYLAACAARAGTSLSIGRDGSDLSFNNYDSKYRRDGSQFYTYRAAQIYGREIVDTFFLAMKYDTGRKYPNYRLKEIIKFEGLEAPNRQHYDGSLIAKNYLIPDEFEKIKRYAERDADDAVALFDLMAPSFFYLARSIPKSFQTIINTASGSWLNSFLVRSYLSENQSIPKASVEEKYEGAISLGNPGIYKNVYKVDVASLYPSIMLQYGIHDAAKDPRCHFQRMVEYFTRERLVNKKFARDTGNRYYKDLEQSQKIVINSAYGMFGAPGLNFNSPVNAALVTAKGREILQSAIGWAAANGYTLVNADTDSISVAAPAWTPTDRAHVLAELNKISPDKISWEDDGLYDRVLVLKIKNYVLEREGKRTIKGSAMKATMKEPALREFINSLVTCLLDGTSPHDLYDKYVREILTLKSIDRWASKKTVTEAVLNGSRTTEQRICDALDDDSQQGDKVLVYFAHGDVVKQSKAWSNDHDERRLLKKLYSTLEIFAPVLDVKSFRNWSLKGSDKYRSEMLTKHTFNDNMYSEVSNHDGLSMGQEGPKVCAPSNHGPCCPSIGR